MPQNGETNQKFGFFKNLCGGIHYRNTINLGWEQGVQIAENAIQSFYLPGDVYGEQGDQYHQHN
jgi:hypothetical protein